MRHEIQTDHPIQARKADLELINKKKRTCHLVGLVVPADHWEKIKESEKIDKCLDLTRELKKAVEYESENDTSCSWRLWNDSQGPRKETGRTEGEWKNRDHRTFKNRYNTEKSPGDLRKLAVAQTSRKNHELKLLWKTRNEMFNKRMV